MRLEELRRELVAFADFRPVILVHGDLRPRFGIEIRVTPDGRHQVGRSNGSLFAESPTVQQFTDVSHVAFPPQSHLPASALPPVREPDATRYSSTVKASPRSPRLP